MKLNLDFPYALDIAVGIYAHMWKQIPLEPKSTLYAISNASMGAVIVAAAIKLFFSKDAYTNLLIFLLKHSVPLYAGIIILAALPGIIALWERRPLPGAAKTCYITANIRYNEVGALIAILMTGCVLCNVKNLRMLPLFYTEQIASIFVPLCLWIALFYQYEEQRKNLPDHSPSLAWKNQICNILHLANVYFWGLFSALLLICYILSYPSCDSGADAELSDLFYDGAGVFPLYMRFQRTRLLICAISGSRPCHSDFLYPMVVLVHSQPANANIPDPFLRRPSRALSANYFYPGKISLEPGCHGICCHLRLALLPF